MFQAITVNLAGPAKRRKLNGKYHTVVPAVLMYEGVWEGARGPVFYSKKELESACPAWNCKPLVKGHPQKGDEYVSAGDPDILDEFGFGVVLNTRWEDEKQKAEAWIDEDKANDVFPNLLPTIRAGKKVELSTGLFLDPDLVANEAEPKNHDGKDYTIEAKNHRPDHLAVLVGEEGACSCKAGCGLNVHSKKQTDVNKSVHGLSDDEKKQQLYQALAEKHGQPGQPWPGYVHDVFPDSVVYSHDGMMHKHDYSADGDKVKLKGKPTRVERQVNYVPVRNSKPDKETDMAFDRKSHIDQLIANGGWKEEQRPKLEALEEDVLQNIRQVPITTNKAPEQPKVTLRDVLVNSSPEVLKEYEELQQIAKEKREADEKAKSDAIKTVMANNTAGFNEEYLKTQPLPLLQGMARMASTTKTQAGDGAPPMFIGNTGGVPDFTTNAAPNQEVFLDYGEEAVPNSAV